MEKVTLSEGENQIFVAREEELKLAFEVRSSGPFALSGLITQVRWQTTCATILSVEIFEEDCFRRKERGFWRLLRSCCCFFFSRTHFCSLCGLTWAQLAKPQLLGEILGGREGKVGWGGKGLIKPSNFDKLFHRFKSPHSCSLGFVESLPSFSWLLRTKSGLLSTYRRRKQNPLLRLQIAVLAHNKDVLMCLRIAHFEAAHGSRFLRRGWGEEASTHSTSTSTSTFTWKWVLHQLWSCYWWWTLEGVSMAKFF